MSHVKGVVREADSKALFVKLDVPYIIGILDEYHRIDKVDLILVKNMFKGLV